MEELLRSLVKALDARLLAVMSSKDQHNFVRRMSSYLEKAKDPEYALQMVGDLLELHQRTPRKEGELLGLYPVLPEMGGIIWKGMVYYSATPIQKAHWCSIVLKEENNEPSSSYDFQSRHQRRQTPFWQREPATPFHLSEA